MSWTAPMTWADGSVPTAGNLNTHLRDNLLVQDVAQVAAAGDMVYASGATAFSKLALPTAQASLRALTVISGVPAWGGLLGKVIRCTADTSTSSGSAQSITGNGTSSHFAFDTLTGEKWIWEAYIYYTGAVATRLEVSGITGKMHWEYYDASNNWTYSGPLTAIGAHQGKNQVRMWGTNAESGSTIELKFFSNGVGTSVTIKQTSWLVAYRIK